MGFLGRTTTTRFEQVKYPASKKGQCSKCKKSRTRSKTFIHTVNPFNKNKAGVPKSYAEVREDVKKEAEKWKAEPLVCAGCED